MRRCSGNFGNFEPLLRAAPRLHRRAPRLDRFGRDRRIRRRRALVLQRHRLAERQREAVVDQLLVAGDERRDRPRRCPPPACCAVGSSSAAGTTRLTSPQRSAVAASRKLPLTATVPWRARCRSAATASGDSPQPGITPTRAWVSAKRAFSLAIRMSQASATSNPPVIATPLIAPITGLRHSSIALTGFSSAPVALAEPSAPGCEPELLQVEPGGEGALARAGQHHRAHVVVGVDRGHHLVELARAAPSTAHSSPPDGSASPSRRRPPFRPAPDRPCRDLSFDRKSRDARASLDAPTSAA